MLAGHEKNNKWVARSLVMNLNISVLNAAFSNL